MPADVETVTAIHEANEKMTRRIEQQIEKVAKAGLQASDRVERRIEQHEATEAGVLMQVTSNLRALQQEIADHKAVDDREITRLDGLIAVQQTESKGIWRWILGATTAGGIGGGIMTKFFGGGGGS